MDILKIMTESINNVIDARINKLNYIYHIKGKILRFNGNKEYTIEYNGNEITAFNYKDLILSPNDVVDILYSNVDPTYRVINFKY